MVAQDGRDSWKTAPPGLEPLPPRAAPSPGVGIVLLLWQSFLSRVKRLPEGSLCGFIEPPPSRGVEAVSCMGLTLIHSACPLEPPAWALWILGSD